MGGARGTDPCYREAESLAEAWENTEACFAENDAMRALLARIAQWCVFALFILVLFALLGQYSRHLHKTGQLTPIFVIRFVAFLRGCVPLMVAYVAWHGFAATGLLPQSGPLYELGNRLEHMLVAAPHPDASAPSDIPAAP